MSNVSEKFESGRKQMPTKYGVLVLPQENNGLSRKERRFLDLALRTAEASEVENRHGAVVVKNGRVLSLGINKWRNKGLHQAGEYAPVLTFHAEVDALSRVADAEGAVLYIARAGRNGEPRISRPCFRCMKAIEDAGIKRIVYTVD